MPISINEELAKLPQWKHQACANCGRKYPETLLNIEGSIHHGSKIICLDTKSCERARKRKRK